MIKNLLKPYQNLIKPYWNLIKTLLNRIKTLLKPYKTLLNHIKTLLKPAILVSWSESKSVDRRVEIGLQPEQTAQALFLCSILVRLLGFNKVP